MTVTLDFDFEEMLFDGLLKEESAKKDFMQFIHYLMFGSRAEMDDETWNQLEDMETILGGTESWLDEHDGCWYIRVFFTDEEIAHDSGNVIERIIKNWNDAALGDLKSNKAHSYLEGYGTLVEDTEDEN